MTSVIRTAAAALAAALIAACGSATTAPAAHHAMIATAGAVPRPAHVVVVIEENHSYGEIIGNAAAPFINSLAAGGASFTDAHGVTHPSQPNYLALFSGSTQGVTSDTCPPPGSPYAAANLASELTAAGLSFGGYAENLPADHLACTATGGYARKHVPWVDFSNVPAADTHGLAAFPTGPAGFAALPAVSLVIPNLCHDMHNCSVGTGDTWLKNHLAAYATWAKANDSLLIVTWDEDDFTAADHIPLIIYGGPVVPGQYGQTVNHYNVLATLLDAYGLAQIGNAAAAGPITGCWP